MTLPQNMSGAQAQSVQTWSDPINLSLSGGASDPILTIDGAGALHIFWLDQFAGYKYTASADGINWSVPVTVNVPFEDYAIAPMFINDTTGRVHIFWTNEKDALVYAQTDAGGLDSPASWRISSALDAPVYDFDASVDASGNVHVSYVKNPKPPSDDSAGVYYLFSMNRGITWEQEKLLYDSPYFRSLDATSAHVRIVASGDPGDASVYSVWDDPSQKRVFLGISRNAGKDWEPIREIVAPDALLGSQTPFHADVTILDQKILLTWRMGDPAGRCSLYSRSSNDGGESWDEPLRFLAESAQCPERSDFIAVDPKYAVMLFTSQGELSLIAWNGAEWSNPESQTGPTSILNPVTIEPVVLRCQNVVPFNSKLFVVGCDQGGSNDIWYLYRELEPMDSLFPLPSAWAAGTPITTVAQKITPLAPVADLSGNLHLVWIRSGPSDGVDYEPRFEYARWNGAQWSDPAPILTDLGGLPIHPAVTIDPQERLLLTWVNASTGDLWFSWANSARANTPLEWAKPIVLPSPSNVNESPSIIVDASGRIVVAYVVSINEERGVYLTQSTDLGITWLPPQQAFDAVEADWDRVDQPRLTFTEDGALHLLFSQFSAHADSDSAPLYYSHSKDGGTTWSVPELVSSDPVSWSYIAAVPHHGLHRFWQQQSNSITSTYHQISLDGGATWSSPAKVSTKDTLASVPAIAPDWMGNIHLLQTSLDEFEYLEEWLWSDDQWQLVEAKKISVPQEDAFSDVAVGLTTTGELSAIFHSGMVDEQALLVSELSSMQRSLELSQAFSPVMSTITVPVPQTTSTETNPTAVSSTPVSPLAGLQDTPPGINRNAVGLALVVIVVLVILVTLLPNRRK